MRITHVSAARSEQALSRCAGLCEGSTTLDKAMEAWYINESDADQRLPHKCDPNKPVSLKELKHLGVFHWTVGETVD